MLTRASPSQKDPKMIKFISFEGCGEFPTLFLSPLTGSIIRHVCSLLLVREKRSAPRMQAFNDKCNSSAHIGMSSGINRVEKNQFTAIADCKKTYSIGSCAEMLEPKWLRYNMLPNYTR